ncbi:hypothetical protein MMC13_007824 [Lambiella insularis]|nr:hypothetical protein [Lambiella insularis]
MSYAAAAAKGPKQSPEEAYVYSIPNMSSPRARCSDAPGLLYTVCSLDRAPAQPEIAHEEASIGSLVDVDSPHISSVDSDYSGKTNTQAEREEREAEEAEREAREKFNEVSDEASKKYEKGKKEASAKGKEAEKKAKEYGHDISEASKDAKQDLTEKAKVAGRKAKEAGHEVNEQAKIAGRKAKEAGHEMNERAREAGQDLNENRDNPVVIGNALIIGLGSAFIGFGAYKKYQAGELNWQVGGLWAGAIGLFALGDYYMSQYLFKNKYPRK